MTSSKRFGDTCSSNMLINIDYPYPCSLFIASTSSRSLIIVDESPSSQQTLLIAFPTKLTFYPSNEKIV